MFSGSGLKPEVPPDLVKYCYLWHSLPLDRSQWMWFPWFYHTVDLVDNYICRVARNMEPKDSVLLYVQVFDAISMQALRTFLETSW